MASVLPKYRCHKIVSACKIKEVSNLIIIPEDDKIEPFEVSAEYLLKHQPKKGGYFVVYEDNYLSYSPASAFESGYTLIEK